MNSEREKADILFDYGLPLQFCCHLIQFYTLLFLRVATLSQHAIKKNGKLIPEKTQQSKQTQNYCSGIRVIRGQWKCTEVYQLANLHRCRYNR